MRTHQIGLGVTVLALGCLGCGSDCKKLQDDITAAASAFAPQSSNMCTSASDCTIVNRTIYRNGRVCQWGCGEAATNARAAELSAFLTTDPGVTAACNKFQQAGCQLGPPLECPCVGAGTPSGCGPPQCVAGSVCQ